MRLTTTYRTIFDAMLCLSYPQGCVICGASVESRSLGVACEACWAKTRILDSNQTICWKCGRPAATSLSLCSTELRCGECEPQYFTAARACGVYEGALRQSVLELKKRPHVPARLTELLAALAGRPPLNAHTRILPVPLHPKRERMRGFNQASILAATLSRRIQMPVDEQSLMRTGHSEQYRAGLDYKGRAQTVAGVFQVSQPRLIKGENILLVDDVFTTGATSSSCAEVLIGAGAAEVFVLTIARPGH